MESIYKQASKTGNVTLINIFHPLHKLSLLDRKEFAKVTLKEYNKDLPSDYSVQGKKEVHSQNTDDLEDQYILDTEANDLDIDHKKSYVLAVVGGISIGASSFIMSQQSKDIGQKSLYPQFIGTSLVFALFQFINWLIHRSGRTFSYLSLQNSVYAVDKEQDQDEKDVENQE